MKEVYLNPGEYYIGGADCRIRTLLGSCVSITLWHPGKRVGAMSHFLLADRVRKPLDELDPRYAEEAIWLMLRDLAREQVDPPECQAKIFGGGNMFPQQKSSNSALNIGRQNGEAAHRLLNSYGIPIISESLYGEGHRLIIFDVASGDVWSRQVKPNQIGSFNMSKTA